MGLRWSVILPIAGLLLFTAVTIHSSAQNQHDAAHPRKYFWWSSLRLDTDPLNKRSVSNEPCSGAQADCTGWSRLPNRWIAPGLLDRILVFSALPAFFAGAVVVVTLSKAGVDEVLSFMVGMPILLFGWYYLVGWLIERWSVRRRQRDASLKLR